jgi:hypothetical protein
MRARRQIFFCKECDELFIDQASLLQHWQGCFPDEPPRRATSRHRWRWPGLLPALLLAMFSTCCLGDTVYRFCRWDLPAPQRELHRHGSAVLAAVLPGHSFGIHFETENQVLLTIAGSAAQREAAQRAVVALWPAGVQVEALPDTRWLATPRARLAILTGSILLAAACWGAVLAACHRSGMGLRAALVAVTAVFLVLQNYLGVAATLVLLGAAHVWPMRLARGGSAGGAYRRYGVLCTVAGAALLWALLACAPRSEATLLQQELQAMRVAIRSVHHLQSNWLIVVEPALAQDLQTVYHLACRRRDALGLTPGRISVVTGTSRRFPPAAFLGLGGLLLGTLVFVRQNTQKRRMFGLTPSHTTP